jgi:hypothetical protein
MMMTFESIFVPAFLAVLSAGIILMALERTYNEMLYRRIRREESKDA